MSAQTSHTDDLLQLYVATGVLLGALAGLAGLWFLPVLVSALAVGGWQTVRYYRRCFVHPRGRS